MLENLLGDKKEDFENYKEPNITDLDECRKVDLEFDNKLNCQTASNIPLTPIKNSFFVNYLFNNDDSEYNLSNDLKKGTNCMSIPKLLYDGIYEGATYTFTIRNKGSGSLTIHRNDISIDYNNADNIFIVLETLKTSTCSIVYTNGIFFAYEVSRGALVL
jgi:hypothetical protein